MSKPVLFTTLQDSNFYGSVGDNLDAQGTHVFLFNLRKLISELSSYFSVGLVCSEKSFEIINSHPLYREVDFAIRRNSDSLFMACKQVVDRSSDQSEFFLWFNSRNLIINPCLIKDSFLKFIDSQLPCMLSVTSDTCLCLDPEYLNSSEIEATQEKLVFERDMIKPFPKYNKMMFGFKNDCSSLVSKSFVIDQCYLCEVAAPFFPEDLPKNISEGFISDLMLNNLF